MEQKRNFRLGRLLLWYIPERIIRVPAFFFMSIHRFFLRRLMVIARRDGLERKFDESDYIKDEFTIYIPKKSGCEEKKTAS